MATTTTNYDFILPAVADPIDEDLWGGELNTNFSTLDDILPTPAANKYGAIAVQNSGDNGLDYVTNQGTSGQVFTSNGSDALPSFEAVNVNTVSGTLAVANGGTSLTTLTANNIILGNGTSAPNFVAPSTTGNLLTSNGTTWASATLASTFTSLFAQSISTNGYITLPGGLIIQWGTTSSIGFDTDTTINFPLSFPTACFSVVIVGYCPTQGGDSPCELRSKSTSSFVAHQGAGTQVNTGTSWIALGN
jgi:hypothetical protein